MLLPSDLLEQEGWIQGSYDNSGLCVLGAVGKAFTGRAIWELSRGEPDFWRVEQFFQGTPARWVNWNDQLERTQQEVVAALRQREVELGLRVVEDPIPWAAQMKEVAHVN